MYSLYIGPRRVSRSARHTDTHETQVVDMILRASTNGNGCQVVATRVVVDRVENAPNMYQGSRAVSAMRVLVDRVENFRHVAFR